MDRRFELGWGADIHRLQPCQEHPHEVLAVPDQEHLVDTCCRGDVARRLKADCTLVVNQVV